MDLLLHNLRTIGTHHCDASVGIEAANEIERLRAALDLHETDANLAHRLAIVLECVLLDRNGYYKEGCDLLDEYKAAVRAAMAA